MKTGQVEIQNQYLAAPEIGGAAVAPKIKIKIH